MFATEIGRIMFAIVANAGVMSLLQTSGAHQLESVQPTTQGDIMDEELIGSIGLEAEYVGDDYDIVGDDDDDLLAALEVSGLGDSEIVGARRPPRLHSRSAQIRRIAQKRAAAVIRNGLNKRRRMPLGFAATDITAGVSALVPAGPQNLFRPERLIIPSDIAFDLGVSDIKVGNVSQLVASVEVPAAVFSEVAINTGVTFDTAEVGNQISVQSRNKSVATVEFAACLVGTIAK